MIKNKYWETIELQLFLIKRQLFVFNPYTGEFYKDIIIRTFPKIEL